MTENEALAILENAPENFVIRDALAKCLELVGSHHNIVCSVSGGSDSDIMAHMILMCGGRGKTDFVFFNTGIEYKATLSHLDDMEREYGITIIRERAFKPIPTSVREYGAPFWSKYASDMIDRLQMHDFQWEDEPFEVLLERYPRCKVALKWWCNYGFEKNSQFCIARNPYLKEYMILNPPKARFSAKCCTYSKKKTFKHFAKGRGYDLSCIGVRKAESGIRASIYHNCFSEDEDEEGMDNYRPLFWFSDADKEEYRKHYGIRYSDCYHEYGFKRTGCVCCPYAGIRLADELEAVEKYEPKLCVAVNNIFHDSYEYTMGYLEFRKMMKEKDKEAKKNAKDRGLQNGIGTDQKVC